MEETVVILKIGSHEYDIVSLAGILSIIYFIPICQIT
jgi:hypothetical protein